MSGVQRRPCEADEAFGAYIERCGPIPEAACEIAFQFEGGALRRPALVPDKPERRSGLSGITKHSFQKLVRARGVRASVDPEVRS
jgi:hypothetical protein